MQKFVFFFVWVIFLMSCNKRAHDSEFKADASFLKYAKGFSVSFKEKIKQVEILQPYQGATTHHTYWLVPKDEPVPTHDPSIKIICTPIETIVCTSTTHIPLLDYLDKTDALIGFPTTDYISSEKMRERINAGRVAELGVDKGLDIEKLATLNPGLVMAYTMTSDYGQFKKIEDLKIPVVINAEYLEKHPLGRAEWIKLMALLFNKEKEADSIFSAIEKSYFATKAIAEASTTEKPSALSGIVYGDAWFMPGGQNYAARLLEDAGFNYLWGGDSSTGFLQISFEAVYEKASKADYWIGVGSYASLAEISQADPRYARFKAFETHQVYTYDARTGAKGGNEFLELGYLRPDLILSDLVKIGNPTLLPDHTLFFHRKLE
jgi:iron complex transport system substrate-binding protein